MVKLFSLLICLLCDKNEFIFIISYVLSLKTILRIPFTSSIFNRTIIDNRMNTLCIELNEDEFLENKVVRLQKGWKLHFTRGESLQGKAIFLRVNDTTFDAIFPDTVDVYGLDSQIFKEFNCDAFGAYKYEFFKSKSDVSKPIGCGYFAVVPEWKIANGINTLSLNSLSVITYLAKLLGPLREWEERLMVSKECSFNVLHLTPVQKLGISNSSYSIAEYDQLNPIFESNFTELESFVGRLEHEWHMLTIQDVVWNHAAKNAKWLHEHPECAYNVHNSPHLRPAYVVDRALQQFSREIGEGKWESEGLPPLIDNESQIPALRNILMTSVFPSIRLHEFFQVDIEYLVNEFQKRFLEYNPPTDKENPMQINIIQDNHFRRLKSTIDMDFALNYFAKSSKNPDETIEKFKEFLQSLNKEAKIKAQDHINTAINAIIGHVTYERIAQNGPRKEKITKKSPLVTEYFLHPKEFEDQNWEEDEKLAYDPKVATFLMAFNGWVMNADPLVNFAEWPSQVYLRRELVCWGDSVKLNYGNGPEHCPFLWNYMQKYTEQCARIFHGFRIDNCHSTPIHVAEYFLQAARRIRKELYVVAELFTGSEHLDHIFVNRLGITSLIREAQNAPDSHEQGRFVYRYGGDPVGAFHHKSVRPAPWGVAHALFYDQTHDNPSPVQKRTAYDFVPTAAMCSIAYCASGTVRGYDEFVPHNIDVVKEKRLYRKWAEFGPKEKGLVKARQLLNDLHYQLCATGFTELFVDQVNEDIVAVTRHNPNTHESVLLIAHTCFNKFKWTPECRPISVDGEIAAILFELKTVETKLDEQNGESNANVITGLPNFTVECYENVPLDKSDAIQIVQNSIHFKLFLSGSVIALKINPKEATKKACVSIEEIVGNELKQQEMKALLRPLTLCDFNYLLFRCEAEERVDCGQGTYEIPNFGKLPYCGMQGIRQLIKRIQEQNDLGHPFCANLRSGTWLIDYMVNRMDKNPSLKPLSALYKEAFNPLDKIPHYLRPCYFELLFSYFYSAIEEVLLQKFFANTKMARISLAERLCIASNAFVARVSNALLPPLANGVEAKHSLSAGLPHFAEGIWRNWGRDTFIALPGLLLLTGRHEEARAIILSYAGTLRHGLIPNLLAEGKAPRYNCRDAVWFWLAAIVRYAEMVENGEQIFEEEVLRLYPTDDASFEESSKVEPLHSTVYEALCRHYNGIHFRERNAGPKIDEHMRDEGFNVSAWIDKQTGLVFGGNRWNCGTWMDKMGSSDRAGNRGEPATPRDGATVELQGLALRVARALDKYSKSGVFPYSKLGNSVESGEGITWSEWAAKIDSSFEQNFFVKNDCTEEFVNRRQIIKDSHGSTLRYTDYQLRPNFCIALDAVPDILEPEKAWAALEIAGDVLAAKAPLGICTLDPEDWAYNGDYNNDDDGFNKATAKGWNYHQGPEWLWVACSYMSAKLKVAFSLAQKTGDNLPWAKTLEEVQRRLFRYEKVLRESDWASLPELTNKGGSPCAHSCPAQAWSVGCALETVNTLQKLLEAKKNHRQNN